MSYLNFNTSLEAYAIRNGGLEVCYSVVLFLNMRRSRGLGQVCAPRLWGELSFIYRRLEMKANLINEYRSYNSQVSTRRRSVS